MTYIKYIFAYVLGCLAAISVGKIVGMERSTDDHRRMVSHSDSRRTGCRRSYDDVHAHALAWDFFGGSAWCELSVGHSILEEGYKICRFFIAFHISKPNSIRQIVLTGITIGVGFATMESFGYYSSTAIHVLVGYPASYRTRPFHWSYCTLIWTRLFYADALDRYSGARGRFSGWLVRYEEYFLQAVITVIWLVSAAVVQLKRRCICCSRRSGSAVLFMMSGMDDIYIFPPPTRVR